MSLNNDIFGIVKEIKITNKPVHIYSLDSLEAQGLGKISQFPYSIKILLESVLRNLDEKLVMRKDVESLAQWNPKAVLKSEIPFIPSRVILQDFTGVPAVVDLAAMRSAIQRLGGDPARINPLIPVDLIIDHSIQVDEYGTPDAIIFNEKREFERNKERYTLLRWAQNAFDNFRVVPPGKGIIHQVNLEHLALVVQEKNINGINLAFPDSVLGTDSHTTTINGLGVLGWGVGGIEAEAVMLGQPYYMPIPEVVGVKLIGELNSGVMATDVILTITEMLRKVGVVGKFVEFYGPGVNQLSLPDRATISNMAPEYGSTMGYFPIDKETLSYLTLTGRKSLVELVKQYLLHQGLFLDTNSTTPKYSQTIEFDLGKVVSCLAGPKRPQDRIALTQMKNQFQSDLKNVFKKDIQEGDITHGSVVIAAIASCTNTSNPSVMIGAGLLAKKAVKRGLKTKSYVKTSLAPGSRAVTEYLKASDLLKYLEALGFNIVGYGCTTCIGNSGPLPNDVSKIIQTNDLVVVGIVSGNRNFEGRIHSKVKANYLASPALVVAYAIAGTVNIDFNKEPIGEDTEGNHVYLKDIWPTHSEIQEIIRTYLMPKIYKAPYKEIFSGSELWKNLEIPESEIYEWDPESSYIQEPPFFLDFSRESPKIQEIRGAHVLALLGNTITTDHISPAGAIPLKSAAGSYLLKQKILEQDFNTFGSRRGNHEIMMRGTFGNIRLKNLLIPEKEGSWTLHLPTGEEMDIFNAAKRYEQHKRPLIILAGKDYGTGSSRDWAAKGTYLLGVKAVIAESFERIHRGNLVGMGVLPLQFQKGENITKLGLTGKEIYDILGIEDIKPGGTLNVHVKSENSADKIFKVLVRLDTSIEIEYYRNGGILHTVLRNMINE